MKFRVDVSCFMQPVLCVLLLLNTGRRFGHVSIWSKRRGEDSLASDHVYMVLSHIVTTATMTIIKSTRSLLSQF